MLDEQFQQEAEQIMERAEREYYLAKIKAGLKYLEASKKERQEKLNKQNKEKSRGN